MAMLWSNPLLISLAVLLFVGLGAQAAIIESNIDRDNRPVILFDTFGFDNTGHIDINLTNIKTYVPHNFPQADHSRMGFFITTAEHELQLQQDLQESHCLLEEDQRLIYKLFTLQDVAQKQPDANNIVTMTYEVPQPGGEYSLFFTNCERMAIVSMEVTVSLYNIEWGGHKDYLASGKTSLPKLYFSFFILYTVAGAYWLYIIYKQWASVHRIHILMAILIGLKSLTVLSQAGEYALVKATGSPHGWNIAYYIFGFFRGIMLFTVIVLIGTGWSFLKPFLQDKEKKVIMIVIPLQVFANIATIVLDESGMSSREWFTWRDIFHLVDIICCCAILFPIVWSIKHLREAAHTDGKAARNLVKLTLFRQFYVMVVSYIYFTRIVVYLLQSTMPYHWAWAADLAGEIATLIFYSFTGYKFRPVETNPYFVLDDDEEEAAAQQALKDEEFDL